MFRNIVLACAVALGPGLASYAVPATDALAASASKNSISAKHKKARTHQKKLGLSGGNNGRQKDCWDAECGGGWAPITDKYVIRQCHLTPSGHKPPPWCK